MWSVLVKAHVSVNELESVEGDESGAAYGALGHKLVGERPMGRRPRRSRRHPPGSPHALRRRARVVCAVARKAAGRQNECVSCRGERVWLNSK